MMESCFLGKLEKVGPVVVDDIKRDLLREFTALPQQDAVQSENLQVYLRVRPFTAAESDNKEAQDCVTIEGPNAVVLTAPRSYQPNRQSDKSLPQTAQRFTFTQVFDPESSQKKVFEGSVRGLVRDVLTGGNCLVFTYGVTNAGKTFTFLGPEHDSGLLPRSLAVIFNSIEGRLYARADLKPQRCRDISRLTSDQQAAESSAKKNLLRLLKESDRSQTSGRSTFLDGSSLSSDTEADSFSLDVESNVRFSVWVSFCEIYNDNIHDLLEQVPSGHHRRAVLRLSQDVKGNSFIKDLRWVQVSSSDEAYRVMKIGKKNQSFSSTRLNQLSSRSHSIFSIRILRVDDAGVPRVLGISELSLCDLAGSERCSRTHNTGERLKEAGNINNSLLTLGKCISAMRLNQHTKVQHHVPFRESKLTHFLQFFFCGGGRVSMVVNINKNSACFDETLNVLKFSALAQKVVVLNSRPVVPDDVSHNSAMELSLIIEDGERRRKGAGRGRKISLVAWETTLEDVLEDEDGEEGDEDEEESVMEGTVLEAGGEEDNEEEEEEEEGDMTMEVEDKQRDAALRFVLEAQIREEVSAEFMELYNKMEKDYSERLQKEREILEERAEKRVEILKNLVSKTADSQAADLLGMLSSETEDQEKIREDVQLCLTEHSHTEELEALRAEKQRSHDQLLEAKEILKQQQLHLSELMETNQQKDDIIDRLRTENLEKPHTCSCLRRSAGEEVTRQCGAAKKGGERGDPPVPPVPPVSSVLEDEIWRLQEDNDQKEETIKQLRGRDEELRRWEEELKRLEDELKGRGEELRRREEELKRLEDELKGRGEELRRREEEVRERGEELMKGEEELKILEEELRGRGEELRRREEEVRERGEELMKGEEELKILEEELRGRGEELRRREEEVRERGEELMKEQAVLEQKVQQLTDQEACPRCASMLSSLEAQRREASRLLKENKALVNGIFQLQTEVTSLQTELKEQTDKSDSPSQTLDIEKTRLQDLQSQSEKRTQEEVSHAAMEKLKKESQAALESSSQKSLQIQDLLREKRQLEESLTHSENRFVLLNEESANQRAEFTSRLRSLGEELESEGGALRSKLEEHRRSQEREKEELLRVVSEKETLIEECRGEMETLRKELEHLSEALQRREEAREVEELELEQEQEEEEEEGSSRTLATVRREDERRQRGKEEGDPQTCGVRVPLPEQDVHASPLRSNMADRKPTPGRKRKSCEVQDLVFSEKKRNKVRSCRKNKPASVLEERDSALQKIEELMHNSPSILGSKAKSIISLGGGHSVTTVTRATRPKRGRRKLYKTEDLSQMSDSPSMIAAGAKEEKESDHLIIKRQLRSNKCRK